MRAYRSNLAGRLLFALCLLSFSPVSVNSADIGKPAPDILVRGVDGDSQKLSALQGKIVYVDFWASWCIPCRESFPWMSEMQRKYADRGLVVIAVNLDAKRTDAEAFLARYPAQFRIGYDAEGDSAKDFGVKAMPTSFLVGRDGILLYEHRGFKESQTAPVEAEIQRALGAQ